MIETLRRYVEDHRAQVLGLLQRYTAMDRKFLLRSDIQEEFERYRIEAGDDADDGSPLTLVMFTVQEAAIDGSRVCFAMRPRIGKWAYIQANAATGHFEEIAVADYLRFREHLVDGDDRPWNLEIDLAPFNRDFPKMREPRSIGRGVEFLNRQLSSQLFQAREAGSKALLGFLRVHQVDGKQLMLNDRIETVRQLSSSVARALDHLESSKPTARWSEVGARLMELGFEPGWGSTAKRMRDMLGLLSDILEAPDPRTLEQFLARIPMIFNVVVLSPHGWFAQANVLGRPDTGGQIVYILDQVRALEKEMRKRIKEQGLDIEPRILIVSRLIPEAEGTTCDQPREAVEGTEYAQIVRVPFRNQSGEVLRTWISRFEVWPYLERFAVDVEKEILGEIGAGPDFVIGNYSDGNLVATLLAHSMGVTQCNIAHALEKTKYLLSDLYWKDNEPQYHFSCQFTADLIAMNAADFIITSTYQEIAGREDSIGQYEAYGAFTMPDLYRVVCGIDVFDPKFNIVSPGADSDVYFPYTESKRRFTGMHDRFVEYIDGFEPDDNARGALQDPSKPPMFTMARFDRIKNLTGLVEWYAKSPRLREAANLVVFGGYIDPDESGDAEEQHQIRRMHELMDEHDLDGCVRWQGRRLEKGEGAEMYRCIADRRGAFVQPALFEAFGLTVIEAMATGLPTFATKYGGPLEIIEHGTSGFQIDPNHGDRAADMLAEFFEEARDRPAHWDRISKGGMQRVRRRYTWELYAERMMTLSRIYGFWKYVSDLERAETWRYLEMLYGLQYRPLAEKISPAD